MRIITSVDVQNRFGELLDHAQREPVGISRRGRTVAFVLSPHEYESLMHGAPTPHSAKLLAAARSAVASPGVHESAALLERAAAVKATDALSLADAWIAATAIEHRVTLVHKDPAFRKLGAVAQEALPNR